MGKNLLPGKAVHLPSPDGFRPEKVITLNLNLPLSYPGVHFWALDQGTQFCCFPRLPSGYSKIPIKSSHTICPASLSPINPTPDSPSWFSSGWTLIFSVPPDSGMPVFSSVCLNSFTKCALGTNCQPGSGIQLRAGRT